jgi:exportin-1
MKKGKDNKAVVASNIMYIVGQYPRFLKAHWKFLKTVVKKLFEFMHETHEGVQDMACDTFIKIAQKCKRHFVIHQPEESSPFVYEILDDLPSIINDLSSAQVHVFYEAVGHMIQSQPDRAEQTKLLGKLMEMPNRSWTNAIQAASADPLALKNHETIKILVNVLQTNVAVCTSIGPGFVSQLGAIYLDLLSLYRACNKFISESVVSQGPVATQTPIIRSMRSVKTESLKLVDMYVQKCEDINVVVESMLPPLLEAILGDYAQSVEQARDAQVLNVVSTFIIRVKVRKFKVRLFSLQ